MYIPTNITVVFLELVHHLYMWSPTERELINQKSTMFGSCSKESPGVYHAENARENAREILGMFLATSCSNADSCTDLEMKDLSKHDC